MDVVELAALERRELEELAGAYGATLVEVARTAPIPGSYWGGAEAGLVGARVFVRADTPAHSLLHELCHYVCMDDARRIALHEAAHACMRARSQPVADQMRCGSGPDGR